MPRTTIALCGTLALGLCALAAPGWAQLPHFKSREQFCHDFTDLIATARDGFPRFIVGPAAHMTGRYDAVALAGFSSAYIEHTGRTRDGRPAVPHYRAEVVIRHANGPAPFDELVQLVAECSGHQPTIRLLNKAHLRMETSTIHIEAIWMRSPHTRITLSIQYLPP